MNEATLMPLLMVLLLLVWVAIPLAALIFGTSP